MTWLPPRTPRDRRRSNRRRRPLQYIEVLEQRLNLSITSTVPTFQVNPPAISGEQQTNAAVAVDPNGDYVVVWQGDEANGVFGNYNIYAQLYNSAGVAQGSAFEVNNASIFEKVRPEVAMNATGNFVVTWESREQVASGSRGDIFAREFDVHGNPLSTTGNPSGNEFLVNTTTFSEQRFPTVAMDPAGDFVIAWQSALQQSDIKYGIYAQRYNSAGVAQGGEFHVNTTINVGDQTAPSAAMDANGNFVIAWQSAGASGTNFNIEAQRFNNTGGMVGSEFQVNSTTSGGETAPSVAEDSAGDFVVAWQHASGTNTNIEAQRYNSSGVAQGTQFQVNSTTANNEVNPAVAMDPAGDFVVTWQSNQAPPNPDHIEAQGYSATGAAVGGQFQVDPATTTTDQQLPAAALNAAGELIITWQGFVQTPGNDQSSNIFAHQYQFQSTAHPMIASQASASPNNVVGTALLSESAILTGGNNPTGLISFSLTAPDGTTTPEGSDIVTGNGTYTAPTSVLATEVGTYTWHSSYSGDPNNSPASDNGTNESLTTVKATPAINTSQQPATATVGSSIADKATVTGGFNPTGTVTFNLYNNPNGTGTPLFTDTEPLSGGKATSKGTTATATGTDYWVATYNGDGNNNPVTSGTALEPVTITSVAPPLGKNDTATIGFWHNQNGQALIDSLNGGANATNLGNWLAQNFPNLYGPGALFGSLKNATNAQVGSYFLTLFGQNGLVKTYAQVLGVALAVYVTDPSLAGGTYAAGFGFNLGMTGSKTYNVGSSGPAIGVPPNSTLTVLQILTDLNAVSPGGVIPNLSGVNTIFSGINQAGDIS
jgi:hypothetical protein